MQFKLLKHLPLWPTSCPRSDKDSAMGVCFYSLLMENQNVEMVRWVLVFKF